MLDILRFSVTPLLVLAFVAYAHTSRQVEIFTMTGCSYCEQAKSYLNKKHIQYKECNITTNKSCNERFEKLGGRGTPLIISGSTRIEGFNPSEIDKLQVDTIPFTVYKINGHEI